MAKFNVLQLIEFEIVLPNVNSSPMEIAKHGQLIVCNHIYLKHFPF